MFNFQQIISIMNNPQIKMLMNSKNPQQMAINMIKNSPNANTDMGRNLISMLERGDIKGIEEYGKNLCSSQGITDEQINNFRNMTGLR